MKQELAERLFMLLMEWDNQEATKERLDIQFLSEFKYDDYQQYTQGMRYVESLVHWIRQFENIEEKKIAYNFIKDNLIFISQEQMMQLVSISFSEYVKPLLIKRVNCIVNEKGIVDSNIKKIIYKYFLCNTLFLGLSDGAHIDYFRRYNSFLDNEQIFMHYDFSQDKNDSLIKDLRERNSNYKLEDYLDLDSKCKDFFSSYVLIDDFSASGISFVRKREHWTGKICKFIKHLIDFDILHGKIQILVILYIATEEAIDYIRDTIKQYLKADNISISFDVQAVQYVEKLEIHEESAIFKLLKKYSDNEIIDRHYEQGKCKYPFLGFNECSIPVVLYHNTPNNSFPILWNDNPPNFKALFPRITRHKGGI